MSDSLAKTAIQSVIFADRVRRLDLVRIDVDWPVEPFRLHVHRTVAAEALVGLLEPFLAYAGYSARITLGPYDDALRLECTSNPDVELIWVDLAHFRGGLTAPELAAFICERVRARRMFTNATMLLLLTDPLDPRAADVMTRLTVELQTIPSVYLCPVTTIQDELGADYAASLGESARTGLPLSGAAQVAVARALGLQWLPAALGKFLKGVAVDLDNTLYDGVLAEDGIDGIVLTPEHTRLHERLLNLRKRGLFLVVLSRNEPADVEELFVRSPDFQLKTSDIDAWGVTWGMKSDALREAAGQLNIAADALLYIDDNPGELAEVLQHIPDISVARASSPRESAAVVDLAPGLFRFADAGSDQLRTLDQTANNKRTEIRSSRTIDEYFDMLQPKLTFAINSIEHLSRAAELSTKTNQFNTNLRRLTESAYARRLSNPDCCTVTISLQDRLTDSGIVGVVAAYRDVRSSSEVMIDEVCISCRALGRNLEHIMLDQAVRLVCQTFRVAEATVLARPGRRNQPAFQWLGELEPLRDGAYRIRRPPMHAHPNVLIKSEPGRGSPSAG